MGDHGADDPVADGNPGGRGVVHAGHEGEGPGGLLAPGGKVAQPLGLGFGAAADGARKNSRARTGLVQASRQAGVGQGLLRGGDAHFRDPVQVGQVLLFEVIVEITADDAGREGLGEAVSRPEADAGADREQVVEHLGGGLADGRNEAQAGDDDLLFHCCARLTCARATKSLIVGFAGSRSSGSWQPKDFFQSHHDVDQRQRVQPRVLDGQAAVRQVQAEGGFGDFPNLGGDGLVAPGGGAHDGNGSTDGFGWLNLTHARRANRVELTG
jgi:hypothetical protein